MAEDLQATGPVEVDEAPQRRRVWRGPWRSVVLPLVVVGAIAGAIWWLDYRPDAGSSPYDARFGPVEMPAALAPPGMKVEAKKGSLAPDFLLMELGGGDFRLSDLRGKAVIVNFWATWRLFTNVRWAIGIITFLALAGLMGVVVPQAPAAVRGDAAAEGRWLDVQEGRFGFLTGA